MVDWVRGFLILLGFQGLGWAVERVGVPIPGPVLGLLLFYGALSLGWVKLAWVERTAKFLLHHMVLLFVPLTVGLMETGKVLVKAGLAVGASLVVSYLAVLFFCGLVAQWLLPYDENSVADAGPAGEVEP